MLYLYFIIQPGYVSFAQMNLQGFDEIWLKKMILIISSAPINIFNIKN